MQWLPSVKVTHDPIRQKSQRPLIRTSVSGLLRIKNIESFNCTPQVGFNIIYLPLKSSTFIRQTPHHPGADSVGCACDQRVGHTRIIKQLSVWWRLGFPCHSTTVGMTHKLFTSTFSIGSSRRGERHVLCHSHMTGSARPLLALLHHDPLFYVAVCGKKINVRVSSKG